MAKEEILTPEKQLKNVKLTTYFELIEEFAKYRRLKIYRRVNYNKIHWITSLIAFYDVMFYEVNEEEYKTKYSDLFNFIIKLDYRENPSYETLLKYTREIMVFANETGLTKVSKHSTDEDLPEGADY